MQKGATLVSISELITLWHNLMIHWKGRTLFLKVEEKSKMQEGDSCHFSLSDQDMYK